MSDAKKNFNDTINLPKTDFPMRAGLPKREPEMLKRWEELDIYNEHLKKSEGLPLFNLHDGPPFSNGDIHMGHALNKSLKDFINRSYMMRGRHVPYIPGWDNHGMPIESSAAKIQPDPAIQIDLGDTAPAADFRPRGLDSTQPFSL